MRTFIISPTFRRFELAKILVKSLEAFVFSSYRDRCSIAPTFRLTWPERKRLVIVPRIEAASELCAAGWRGGASIGQLSS